MLKKTILMTAGGTVFAAGLILFPLSVPLGLPTMVIGLSIMLKASNKIKRTVIRLFKKNRHSSHVWRKDPCIAPQGSLMPAQFGLLSSNLKQIFI